MSHHAEDSSRYQELLEETASADGVVHRDQAIKQLTEELAEDADRAAEYAGAQAQKVADSFDRNHRPFDEGQLTLDIDAYLVIGENERIAVEKARAQHARQWLDIQTLKKAQHDAAYGLKTMQAFRLLRVMEERNCTMWEAERFLQDGES